MHALLGTAVSKGFGLHSPAGLSLQMVVTHGGGGGECLLDIASLQNVELTIRVMRPDAGETVGLQFHPDL